MIDISDIRRPRTVGAYDYHPPFPGFTHTVVPLFERGLLLVADEATTVSDGEDWPKRYWIADVRDETNPVLISSFPVPEDFEQLHAEAGLAMAVAEGPDLVLMDVQLPGMDGLQATALLKAGAETRSIPVIALTALAMKGEESMTQNFVTTGSEPLPIWLMHETTQASAAATIAAATWGSTRPACASMSASERVSQCIVGSSATRRSGSK